MVLTFDLTSVMAPNPYCLPMKAPVILATMWVEKCVMSDKILRQDLVSLCSKIAGCWNLLLDSRTMKSMFVGSDFSANSDASRRRLLQGVLRQRTLRVMLYQIAW